MFALRLHPLRLSAVLGAAALSACGGAAAVPAASPAVLEPAQSAQAAHAAFAVAAAPAEFAALPDSSLDIAGTYEGSFSIVRGGKTYGGTIKLVIRQSGASIDGTNKVVLDGRTIDGTETGSVARGSSGTVDVSATFSDKHGLGTGTISAVVTGKTLAGTGDFRVDGRLAGTASFDTSKT